MTVLRTKEGALTERVARLLLGAPDGTDPEKGQVRFRDIAVNLKTGRFFDFEDETSGTHIELIQRFKNLHNGQAEKWLKENVTDASPDPLPQELIPERALLGMLAMQPVLVAAIEEEVTVDAFAEPVHKQLFAAIAEYSGDADKPLTPKFLIDAAGGDPLYPVYEGYPLARYVGILIVEAPMSPDAAHLARTIAAHIRSAANRDGDIHDEYDLEPELPPFEPTMGLRMWVDQDAGAGRQYEFSIQGLIPERQVVMVIGESGTGKSFLTFSMMMSLARGTDFFGRRVHRQMGVILCAYEAAAGAGARMRVYRSYHGLDLEPLPFAALEHPIAIWPNDPNGAQLIAEIQGIGGSCFGPIPLGAIVVDTYNAATTGASEIDSEVVSRIRSYFNKLVAETGATLIIVGHTNAAGKHRGNEQLPNNVDTIIKVSMKTVIVDRQVIQIKDDQGREVRTMKVVKQREGRAGGEYDFVLAEVPDGTKDQYGENRTSCVVVPLEGRSPAKAAPGARKGPKLTAERKVILDALSEAVEEYGEPTPSMLKLPRSIVRVVNAKRWKEVYLRKAPDDSASDNTINKRLRDASNQFQELKLIGRINPFVWIVPGKAEGLEAVPQLGFPEEDI